MTDRARRAVTAGRDSTQPEDQLRHELVEMRAAMVLVRDLGRVERLGARAHVTPRA